jgi:hypothetical protein
MACFIPNVSDSHGLLDQSALPCSVAASINFRAILESRDRHYLAQARTDWLIGRSATGCLFGLPMLS